MPDPIALIGLGLVGKTLITRLVPAGYAVLGYDISGAARTEAEAFGALIAADACDAARQCPVVLLSLPDSAIVCRLFWDNGLAEALQPSAVVLDTTTGWPAHAQGNARRLAERGVHFADVTLHRVRAVTSDDPSPTPAPPLPHRYPPTSPDLPVHGANSAGVLVAPSFR